MAKRKSVLERKTLTKQERAILRELKKKLGVKKELTAKKYLEFLKQTAKANKKLEELSSKSGYLGGDKRISPDLSRVTSPEELLKRLNKPTQILDVNYETEINEWYRDRFIKNIEEAFGDSLGAENLTYEQIQDLISRNPQLSFLLHYHKGNQLAENLGLFGVIEEDIEQAIREEVDYYDEYET